MFKRNKKKDIVVAPEGSFRDIWRALIKNKRAVVGLIFIVVLVFVAIFADKIAPFGMTEQNLSNALQHPNGTHLLGTDALGRDVLSRILYGARVSVTIGISAVIISLFFGGIFGLLAGYYGGKVDTVIMRFTDVLLSIPSILLAIAIVASFGPSLMNLILAIGIGGIPSYTRIVRSAVMAVREKQFIEAAHAIGLSNTSIMIKHIVPNVLSPVIVQATMGVASAILSAAGLGFIGLGIEASVAEWGTMLSLGREHIRTHTYLTVYPGLAIMLTILAFNLLGDGIRDAIDPKMRD
ncbi:ABC transporter permease [Erysipelothrix aquatica]|uniref:ABC transporter permease n=1 Tax=Erysipelothrix aquatica TaxID=2683714 RepID=UPI0013589BD5|nr:ABC transporter permease [Erysipelothrix aquatica]